MLWPFWELNLRKLWAITNNSDSSGYSNHVLNLGHTYDTLTDTMEILKTEKRSI
jgi:hypothetical protein